MTSEINKNDFMQTFGGMFRNLVDRGVFGGFYDENVEAIKQVSDIVLPLYPKLSVFDERDLRRLFLTEPSIVLSQFSARVFGGDSKFFLEFPSEYSNMLPADAYPFIMGDVCLFLHNFGKAYGLSWDRGQEISREFMYKLKTDYGSVLTSPIFQKCSVRPRKYVIHHMSGSNFGIEQNDIRYDCCHEREGGVDMVLEATMLPPTFVQYDKTMGVTDVQKCGQVKLTIVELNFLTHLLVEGRRFDTVLILGAAPGYHYSILPRCFPDVRFFAIDKRPMCPIPGIDFIPYEENMDFMFLAPMLGGRKQVAIISDIYNEVLDIMYDIVYNYVQEVQRVADVVGVMEKFLVEYKSVMVPTYTGARYWFQPHVKKSAGEMRRIWYPSIAVRNYVSEKSIENQLCMHNQYMRPRAKKDGRCFDCHYVYLVAQVTQSITGYNIVPFVKRLLAGDYPVPPEYRIFERVKTYDQLKRKQDKGFIFKKQKYMFSLTKTRYGALYRSGNIYVKIPRDAIDKGFLSTSQNKSFQYTTEKVVWVNDEFLVKVPPYTVEGTLLRTWVYGSMQWYEGKKLGCFQHVVEGDPPAMFMDHRQEIKSVCGCVWRKTGNASIHLIYDEGD
jgi:hypothetical protein